MPPSEFLGLPWPRFGETDQMLALAYDTHKASLCPCGCGQPAQVAHDDATDGRWQPELVRCYAGAALEQFRKDKGEHLPDGALIGVRLLPEGAEPIDPLEAMEAVDAAEMQARHAEALALLARPHTPQGANE